MRTSRAPIVMLEKLASLTEPINLSGCELLVNGWVDVRTLAPLSSGIMNLSGGVATIKDRRFPTNNGYDQFNMSRVDMLRITGMIFVLSGRLSGQDVIDAGYIENLQVEEDNGVIVNRIPEYPNANGIADVSGINSLTSTVNDGSNDLRFDITADDFVNGDDRPEWVTKVALTVFNDTDLNGKSKFADFVTLSNNFNTTGG